MTATVQIEGTCDPRFAAVRDAFRENFAARDEVGAAVCVCADGKVVVDLWGGYADSTRTRRWERNTVVDVASTSKGLTAICVLMLVDRGLLDLDAPVAHYWPEFAQARKAKILVRWLLSHRAGLPALRQEFPLECFYNWEIATRMLAETEPWWQPGAQHGYHALTFGYLAGELIRRITGLSVGQFLQREVAGPLGEACFIGVPPAEQHRVADVLPAPPLAPGDTSVLDAYFRDPESMSGRTLMNSAALTPEVTNSPAWRSAEIPAANAHTSAAALGRIYGALARGGELDGIRLLSPAIIEAATVEQSVGWDAVLLIPTRFGLGFMLPMLESTEAMGAGPRLFGPSPHAFGYPGAGGSFSFADSQAGIGFGYVMNQWKIGTPRNPDLRAASLVEAVYSSLGMNW